MTTTTRPEVTIFDALPGILAVVAVGILICACALWLNHVSTQWYADQQEASAPSGVGHVPARTLTGPTSVPPGVRRHLTAVPDKTAEEEAEWLRLAAVLELETHGYTTENR